MTAEPAPLTDVAQQAVGIVVPATARHFVAIMRLLEESTTDPSTRWELLRQRLEQLARESKGAS